ncbi:hypothetical protein RND71_001844 [Anisodus tanguticus]|uniref:Fe2OG dioxygenase domain-containing protein n=1 Tax=Anisodus tanguticus TaxID=243964 RepID=A0AAE1T337_9SOLA|nr:hypothetical protein RND71_001844 [Anisodus tanguticus]
MAPVPSFPVKVGHIDDVQELKKTKPSSIPERFVRDIIERPKLAAVTTPSSCNLNIPVVDLSKLLNSQDLHYEIKKLSSSCDEWGFFQVINHGIDLDLLEKMEKIAMEFFMLPLEEKQIYPMAPGTVQDYGQAFVFSEDQKLDWCNMFALGVEPHFIRNPKLWPTKPLDFSHGLNEDIFEEMFGVAVQAVRMNYYPACPRPDLVLGLSPHSDGSALTELQQGKGSSVGLQILKDNVWVPVQPIPNALVINIGDTIEVLTNGRYKSVEHRAVTHQEKDRLSIVTFYAPSYEIELGLLQELVDENNPCKYKRSIMESTACTMLLTSFKARKLLSLPKSEPTNHIETPY